MTKVIISKRTDTKTDVILLSVDRKLAKCPWPPTRISSYGNAGVNTEFVLEFKRDFCGGGR